MTLLNWGYLGCGLLLLVVVIAAWWMGRTSAVNKLKKEQAEDNAEILAKQRDVAVNTVADADGVFDSIPPVSSPDKP